MADSSNDPHALPQNLALGGLLLAPIILAIPPRRFDLPTMFMLGGAACCASYLYDQGQQGRLRHTWLPLIKNVSLEERKRRLDVLIQREEAHLADSRRVHGVKLGALTTVGASQVGTGATEREKTIAEDKRKLEEGKGLQGIITDQIWEVWNQGKKTKDEDEDD